MSLKPILFDTECYRTLTEPVYLLSGEFHYFRVPKGDWHHRMRLFKNAGGNVIATYIPWLLHEPEEGSFVWGESADWLDLEGFLQSALDEDLYVIARPGPYQYSELIYDGLPGWLCENYPEILARNPLNEIFRKSSVSYIHPTFLGKVKNWFSKVGPILARYTLSNGGPVAFVQIDNEMAGIHEWFDSLDYNPASMGFNQPEGRFPKYLKNRYQNIDKLNAQYNSHFEHFEQVFPSETNEEDIYAIRRRKDYFHFYLKTLAEYSVYLVNELRSNGIDTPIVHNAANPGMNAYFIETSKALGSQFLLGSDHYYTLDQTWAQNHPTPQYIARCFISLEELRLMGFPPTVFELPGGSCSDWPPITPTDALACYMGNLAYGMKGHNYYIFTGGPNPPGAGATTEIYDYNASIGPNGDIRPLYEAQKAFGGFIANHPWFVNAKRQTDFYLGIDFEYTRTDHYWNNHKILPPSPHDAWDLLRKGPLTTALCAGFSPEMIRLDQPISPTSTPLVVIASSSMSANNQQNMVNYLQSGGNALILPVLPTVDDDLQSCTILADFLGSPQATLATRGFYRANIRGIKNVLGEITFWDNLPDSAQVIGLEENSGRTIAWKLETPGGGQALILGFRWTHAMREHLHMFSALLGTLGLKPVIQCTNPNIWTTLWVHGHKAIFFLLNLFTASMDAEVSINLSDGRCIHTGLHHIEPVTVKTYDFNI